MLSANRRLPHTMVVCRLMGKDVNRLHPVVAHLEKPLCRGDEKRSIGGAQEVEHLRVDDVLMHATHGKMSLVDLPEPHFVAYQ